MANNRALDDTALEAFKVDYRTGAAVPALIEKYGVSKATAYRLIKTHGLRRDLIKDVAAARESALSAAEAKSFLFDEETGEAPVSDGETSTVSPAPASARPRETEQTAIIAAATAQVAIVKKHRASLGRLNRIIDKLVERIEQWLDDPEAVKLAPKESISGLIEQLTRALAKSIPLERQAYGVDAAEEEERAGGVEERVRAVMEERERKAQEEATARIARAGPKVASLEDARKRAANE